MKKKHLLAFHSKTIFINVILPILLSLFNAPINAQIIPSYLFSDGMVLQRNIQVPIFGSGTPGENVVVTFAKQTKKTSVDSKGKWKIYLDPMKSSSQNQNLIIANNKHSQIIYDVLIGDVWLCSGQSNMEFSLSILINKHLKQEVLPIVNKLKRDARQSNDSMLRLIRSNRNESTFRPLEKNSGNWLKATNSDVLEFSAVAFYFGKALRESLQVPVGLILNAYGGTPIESWLPMHYWQKNDELTNYYNQYTSRLQANLAINNKKLTPEENRHFIRKSKLLNKRAPSSMYNAMHSPVIPYAIKGVIWYQGEANANTGIFVKSYDSLMTDLITIWRKDWQQPELPFYYVQLANIGKLERNKQRDNDWPILRDKQRLSMSIPNTGMAVTIDIGQADDIHPKNKIAVGNRLAKWALTQTYGKNVGEYSGPMIKKATLKNSTVILDFEHVGSGLVSATKRGTDAIVIKEESLIGFELKDSHGQWHHAKATIIKENRISLSVLFEGNSQAVRYAWSINPHINFYNQEGLPASPFQIEVTP